MAAGQRETRAPCLRADAASRSASRSDAPHSGGCVDASVGAMVGQTYPAGGVGNRNDRSHLFNGQTIGQLTDAWGGPHLQLAGLLPRRHPPVSAGL